MDPHFRSSGKTLTLVRLLVATLVVAPCSSVLARDAGGEVQVDAPSWRIAQAEVKVVCPMTVGGSFEAKTQSLSGILVEETTHPLSFVGDLSVDLMTLDTGIGLRNDHLETEYLEVGKGAGFQKAVLSALRLGRVDSEAFVGRTPFTASFALHGRSETIAGEAVFRREGDSIKVDATFPLFLDLFGIPKPQYLGVGVKTQVQVKVSLRAMPAAGSGGGSR